MNPHLETRFTDILRQHRGGTMMEIGCAGPPHPRHQLIAELGITYHGLDREIHCSAHPPRERYTYWPNHDRGDYNWTLLKIIRSRLERGEDLAFCDVIFLDGHHSFTIDGLAFYLCDALLKTGGLLVFDDYEWTLREFETYLRTHEYYDGAYDFSRYNEEEMTTPHVKQICDVLVPLTGRYEVVEPGFSFRKIAGSAGPAAIAAARHRVAVPTLAGEFRRRYVRERWRTLAQEVKPIALFGAGRHTRWLLQAVWDVPGPDLVCVLDDNPPAGELCGRPVRRPVAAKPPAPRILISSDAHEEALAARCRELFGDAVEIIRLYAGLPPGPYA